MIHRRKKVIIKSSSFSAFARSCAIIGVLLGVAACSGGDPEEEGGLIGTGLIRGTVSESKILVAEQVEIKASSGEISQASLNANRRFTTNTIEGDGPFLLRTDLGNEFRYAVAYENTPANVHTYSDVVVRSWFATINVNIENEFNNTNPIQILPTVDQYNDLSERIFDVIGTAFSAYDVTGQSLLSDEFNAGDGSVLDEFLIDNPVVVESQSISVLQTDPVTGFQNEARFGLTLNTPDSIVDTRSPSRVANVRALGSGVDEIIVVWDPALDNFGVVAYQVFRDDVLVGTTPFPVFTDAVNLQPNSTYEYFIVAIDGASLQSVDSDRVIGRTLAASNTVAPPVPFDLRISATDSVVELDWNTDVSEVFAFTIYRGVGAQTPEAYIRSSSVRLTDPYVSGGLLYCYQVEAIGASNLTSGRSNPICVTTDGTMITPSSGNMNTGTGGVDVNSIPDAESIECFETLPDSPIVADLTLSGDCYNVDQMTVVSGSAEMVIEAGVILKFAQGVGLEITDNGSLTVNGTPTNPVLFTGMEDDRGFWNGIHYNRTESRDNSMVNAVIEYAGRGPTVAALAVSSTVQRRTRLTVQGSLFRRNTGAGFSISTLGAQIDAFDNNVITENDIAADIGPLVLPMIGSNNTFIDNRDELINVPRLGIDENLIIPDVGAPLKSNGLLVTRANLTLNAGVDIRFQANAAIEIENGDLVVNGTADNRVLLSGLNREPGFWGGVHLTGSNASSLNNLTIEYGGASIGQFDANLALVDSTATVSNVTLSNSSGFGFALDAASSLLGEVELLDNLLQ